MPKRKFHKIEDELDSGADCSQSNSDRSGDDDSNQSANSVSCGGDAPIMKKRRKGVDFEKVEVFYFPRTQGFMCVPSQGGTTLGMTEKHMHQEQYTVKHYRKLRKIVRRKKAYEDETAENSFNIDSILDITSDEIEQTDSEEDDTEMDGFYLQPVPTKQRRSLLKLSGVRKLDLTEKDECKELRGSREQCGCTCEGVCVPETCLCAQNGIQCQVDRLAYPCGCTAQGCKNPTGRIEFNANKVRRHYAHTMSRIKSEDNFGKYSPDLKPKAANNKHIRFVDEEEEIVAGESSFNSTEKGTCLDCFVTNITLQHPPTTVTTDQMDNHSFQNFNADFYSDNAVEYTELCSAQLTLNDYQDDSDNASKTLQPISDLLNPLFSSVAPAHSSWHMASNSPEHLVNTGSSCPVDWRSLPHESLLTSNSLLPLDVPTINPNAFSSSSHSSSEDTALNACAPNTATASASIDSEFLSSLQSYNNVSYSDSSERSNRVSLQRSSSGEVPLLNSLVDIASTSSFGEAIIAEQSVSA